MSAGVVGARLLELLDHNLDADARALARAQGGDALERVETWIQRWQHARTWPADRRARADLAAARAALGAL